MATLISVATREMLFGLFERVVDERFGFVASQSIGDGGSSSSISWRSAEEGGATEWAVVVEAVEVVGIRANWRRIDAPPLFTFAGAVLPLDAAAAMDPAPLFDAENSAAPFVGDAIRRRRASWSRCCSSSSLSVSQDSDDELDARRLRILFLINFFLLPFSG